LRVDETEETKGVQHTVVHHIQNLWHKYHLFLPPCYSQANGTTKGTECALVLHTNIRSNYFITCIPEEIGQDNELWTSIAHLAYRLQNLHQYDLQKQQEI
jgi:hypothetical protein